MAGWTKVWPTQVKDQLKKLGYNDSDINGLIKSTSLADATKHAKEMEKKNAAKAAEFRKLMKQVAADIKLS
jgi:septal ring factor EnvC (AmiA/AmiB activator)